MPRSTASQEQAELMVPLPPTNRTERPVTPPTLGTLNAARDELRRPAPRCFARCPAELAVTMTSSATCGETREARGAGPVGSARRAEHAQPGGTQAARFFPARWPGRARRARGSPAAHR